MFKQLAARLLSSVAQPVIRAFDLGRSGRRLAAIPNVTIALNALIRTYGRSVVARSRYLCINNPYATSAKETFVSSLVGSGIKPSTLGETAEVKKAVQELWLDWTARADADSILDFYGLQGTAACELFETGECFAVLLNQNITGLDGEQLPPLQVRLFPSEQCPVDYNVTYGQNRVEMGIEFDQANNRVAYWFCKQQPGDYGRLDFREYGMMRIPADQVVHMFRPIRAGQIRGVPHTLSALVKLAMLDLYDDAELERKRVAALFAAFVTRDAVNPNDTDHPLGAAAPARGPFGGAMGTLVSERESHPESFELQAGAIIDLEPGEDVTFSAPGDVGQQYEAFMYRQLMAVAAGFNVPYMSMTGDLRQANYGSIRAGLVEFRRRTTMLQNQVMNQQFNRPIWMAFMRLSALRGILPYDAAEYVKNQRLHDRVKWIPPFWDWVDPLKDQQAEKLAVDNGFKSRGDTIESAGNDPEETDQRILDDQEREENLGLKLNRFNTGTAAQAEVLDEQGNPVDPNATPPASDPTKPAPKEPSNG